MATMKIAIDSHAVNNKLEHEGLLEGSVPIESFLIQREGAGPNAATVLIIGPHIHIIKSPR